MLQMNLFFVFMLLLSNLHARSYNSIQRIHSFNEVDFDNITQETLVIFDVNETLIQPIDTWAMNEYAPQAIALMNQIAQGSFAQYLYSIMITQAERRLIEPAVIDIIKMLQSRNIPVIACTAMNTGGPVGIMHTWEEWRYNSLKNLGFEGSFSDHIIYNLCCFARKPLFYKGILATDDEDKGPVIGAFLNIMNLSPAKIIMFDDSTEYLETVKTMCTQRNIIFEGYEYKGAQERPWNQELALVQAEHLVKHHQWISDAQAQEILRQRTPAENDQSNKKEICEPSS